MVHQLLNPVSSKKPFGRRIHLVTAGYRYAPSGVEWSKLDAETPPTNPARCSSWSIFPFQIIQISCLKFGLHLLHIVRQE